MPGGGGGRCGHQAHQSQRRDGEGGGRASDTAGTAVCLVVELGLMQVANKDHLVKLQGNVRRPSKRCAPSMLRLMN